MRWSADGGKICIAYDDGAVIVGGVDGARLWGKDLGLQLCLLQWAPDGAHLLFATAAGECHTYDSSGNGVAKMQLYCNEGYAGAGVGEIMAPQGLHPLHACRTAWRVLHEHAS
jgi:WD repeat-containing protein 35